MRVSLNWLKEYIDIPVSLDELANSLTMVGLEVESIERLGEKYKNFLIGQVLEVNAHPKADKLTICKVNVGKEICPIVCGAPNVRTGQFVAVGKEGAIIPRNQHDPEGKPFVLSRVKIRGIESQGMICSEYELDLGEDKEGILVLDPTSEVGIPLADYLGLNDTVLEIGITPNRPDAMSHLGIAREIGAILNRDFRIPVTNLKESKRSIGDFVSVLIKDFQNCPRYTGRLIFNIKIEPSPKWLQNRLTSVGIRPINNIVDVTNYVLMECGHPLHAFDYDKLTGQSIIIRSAEKNETFTTLDHKPRVLREDTLLICDSKFPIAIAGVMGGLNSEISQSTVNVFLESAYFDPQSIRRTSKHFGISTDASQRFERGADPNITEWAVNRASYLIQQIAGGEVLIGSIDVYPKKINTKEVELRIDKLNELLGINLTTESVSSYLNKIFIKPKDAKSTSDLNKSIIFEIPTFRPDVEREIDLIEEVARLYGYDNIETKARSNIQFPEDPPEKDFQNEIRQFFIGNGFFEVVSNSMQKIDNATISEEKIVKISNPISADMAILRTSLLPSILGVIQTNISHGSKNIRFFEIGKVYCKVNSDRYDGAINGFYEEDRIILAISGQALPIGWVEKPRFIDIYDLKGEVEALFRKIFLDNMKFIPYSNTNALSEMGLHIEIKGKYAGLVGKVSKDLLNKFDIDQDVYFAEMNIESLTKNFKVEQKFSPLSIYPSVMRDIAIIIDENISTDDVEKQIKECGSTYLRKVELFDVYVGEQIGPNNKSRTFALEFMAEDHTMKQKEVDQIMQKIMKDLEIKFNAIIRKQEMSD
ncbi:MAG: phenylalanine--tRNA ligase subunit beta [Bacteroidota bacterium]|nr:phenylalanine--tRNA ligase subunit beta [Bacteroidota bacterium]